MAPSLRSLFTTAACASPAIAATATAISTTIAATAVAITAAAAAYASATTAAATDAGRPSPVRCAQFKQVRSSAIRGWHV